MQYLVKLIKALNEINKSFPSVQKKCWHTEFIQWEEPGRGGIKYHYNIQSKVGLSKVSTSFVFKHFLFFLHLKKCCIEDALRHH